MKYRRFPSGLRFLREMLLAAAVFAVAGRHPAFSQTQASSASLSGIISDSTGARVDHATVILASSDLGISRRYTTDTTGAYSFNIIPPAKYKLTVSAATFKSYEQDGVELQVGESATQNVVLGVGNATEQVVVTGESPLLNTSDANVGVEIDSKQILDLPLNVRNVFGLVTLNSSVNNQAQGQVLNGGGEQGTADQDISFFNFGGGFFGSTAFLLDGAWDTADGWGGVMYVPSVDGTQEFRVQNNSFSAQYGWSTGNVINVVTKSGTSKVHGSAYEFLRNDDLDANGWFNNHNDIPKAHLERNQFGATFGGPLYIPRVYKQHEKTFFFGQYEGLRELNPSTFVGTVPTAAMRSGDFSALLGSQIGTDALNRPILSGQIYNPFSTRQIGVDGSGNPIYIRDPISGNNLSSLLDPVAKNLLTSPYWPTPTNSRLVNNFANAVSAPTTSDEFTIRIDDNLNDKARLYGRFSKKNESKLVSPAFYGANDPAGPGQLNPDNRWNIALGYSQLLTPNFTSTFNLGYVRWVEGNNTQGYPFKPSSLGLPGAIDAASPQFPEITVQGQSPLGPPGGQGTFPNQDGTISEDFAKTMGTHTFTFGYMGILSQVEGGRLIPTAFSFNSGFTAGPNPQDVTASTGFGLGSFALGTAASGSTGFVGYPAINKIYNGVYLEDDWRIVPKLTVNLGVRYEIQGAQTERHNRQAYFDSNAINPISAAVGSTYVGEFVYSGNGRGRGLYKTDYNNFAPRVGFSAQLLPKLVARGGFGIFFPTSVYKNDSASNPGFTQQTNLTSSLNGGLNPAGILSNPFPQGLLPITGNSLGGLTDVGQSIGLYNYQRPSPYVEQWMFGLQYEVTHRDLLDVAYVGNHGLKMILDGLNVNELPAQYLTQGAGLNNLVTNPFYGAIQDSSCGLSNPTIPAFQLLLPHPEFCDTMAAQQAPVGFSNYNALQASYTRRVTSGLAVMASYTYSKFIDNVEGYNDWSMPTPNTIRNFYNLAAEKSVDGTDTPQSLVVNYVYDLPIGRGKKIGANLNKSVDAVVGGWQFTGVATVKDGFPLAVSANNLSGTLYGGNQHANVVGDPKISHRDINAWFNTTAFAQAPAYTFGNAPRYLSNMRGPGYDDWDLGIQKLFNPLEGLRIQFRAEMFNAFNHANFYVPNTTLGSSGFGTITASNPPRDVQLALKLYF